MESPVPKDEFRNLHKEDIYFSYLKSYFHMLMPFYVYTKPTLAAWTIDKRKSLYWELISETPVIILAAAKIGGFGLEKAI